MQHEATKSERFAANRGPAGRIGFWLGLVLFALLVLLPAPADLPLAAQRTAAVTILVATWWITSAIPIPATSLLPLALLPILGVMGVDEVARAYGSKPIFLFLGGFILALGIERWNVHRRIALAVVRAIGTGPRRMVLGFMVASAVLSMWISNTATTLIMLPIVLAVVAALEDLGFGRARTRALATVLLLSVAYAASIGGLSTLIGTPPNLVLSQQLAMRFGVRAPDLPMGRWMLAFLPLSAVFLAGAWLVLCGKLNRSQRRLLAASAEAAQRPWPDGRAAKDVLDEQWLGLGPMRRPERRMLVVFAITALLWVFRRTLPLGFVTIPGWSDVLSDALVWLGLPGMFDPGFVDDAVVAVLMAGLTFMLPSGDPDEPRRPLMDWQTAVRLPWGILLLFGGGFAIAGAFSASGLSAWIGNQFGRLPVGSPLLLVVLTCTLMTFLTELTSNVATANVMLPILAGAAEGLGIDPLLLMLPATISASCAFMLPVATPPNAIVFASGHVRMEEMCVVGIVLNLLGVVLVTLTVYLLGVPVLGVETHGLPAWLAE